MRMAIDSRQTQPMLDAFFFFLSLNCMEVLRWYFGYMASGVNGY